MNVKKIKTIDEKNSSILHLKDIDCPIVPLPKSSPPLDNTKTPLKIPRLQRFATPDLTPKDNLMINHLIEVLESASTEKILMSLKIQTKQVKQDKLCKLMNLFFHQIVCRC